MCDNKNENNNFKFLVDKFIVLYDMKYPEGKKRSTDPCYGVSQENVLRVFKKIVRNQIDKPSEPVLSKSLKKNFSSGANNISTRHVNRALECILHVSNKKGLIVSNGDGEYWLFDNYFIHKGHDMTETNYMLMGANLYLVEELHKARRSLAPTEEDLTRNPYDEESFE